MIIKSKKNITKQKIKYFFFKNFILNATEKKFKVPKRLYIECTNLCNAKCVFCYYPTIADKIKKKYMTILQFKNIVRHYISMGGENIALTPTMADPLTGPFLSERIEFLKNTNIKSLSFYTNLVSFKKKVRESLLNLGSTLQVKINVSFTGFDRDSYLKFMGVDKFDIVKSNLEKLSQLNEKSPLLVSEVTMRFYENCEKSKNSFNNYLRNIKLNSKIDYGFDTWGGLLEDNISKFKELPVKERVERVGPCKVSFEKPLITVNGDFKLCDCRDALDELVVGNVFDSSIEEIWNGDKIKQMRDRFYSDNAIPNVCSKCEYYQSIY